QKLDVLIAGKRELSARNDDRSPMVSPHGVERDADFMGHAVTIPRQRQDSTGSPISPFLQGGEGSERMRGAVTCAWGLKHGAGLARIGVDAEDEELGRQRAEIDNSINQRFGGIIEANFNLPRTPTAMAGRWRKEDEIDRFLDLVLHRLESHAACLTDS